LRGSALEIRTVEADIPSVINKPRIEDRSVRSTRTLILARLNVKRRVQSGNQQRSEELSKG
jgi:hypothetical protein